LWNTSIPESFDVYYHFATKLFDGTPGTIVVKIIIQGYLEVTVKDIV
jgi:hypothetical protein